MADVSHFEIELKKLSTEQKRSVMDLVVNDGMGFDDAVKTIMGE